MIVIKIGGGGGVDLDACCDDVARLRAAGSAVQCMNLMHGWPERLGLEFTGLHPV